MAVSKRQYKFRDRKTLAKGTYLESGRLGNHDVRNEGTDRRRQERES